MSGILVSGNVVCDVLVRPVDELRWGTTSWVDSIDRCVGGNGANTACAAAMMGVPTRLMGMTGSDFDGEWLHAELQAAGVDISFLGRSQSPTAAAVALVRPNGERCFLHRPGSSTVAFPQPLEFPAQLTSGFTHYHLGSPFLLPLQRPHLAETLRRARAVGLVTSVDTQWDPRGEWMATLAPALSYTDILFVNEDEACKLTGTTSPHAVTEALRERGAGIVVLKMGPQGCVVSGRGLDLHQPAFHVPVVDTTGAGDCFVGAYLAALAKGQSHSDASRLACGVAALTIQHLGSITGLKRYEQTLAELASLQLRSCPCIY